MMTGTVEHVSMSVACQQGQGRAILTTSLADTEGNKKDLPFWLYLRESYCIGYSSTISLHRLEKYQVLALALIQLVFNNMLNL